MPHGIYGGCYSKIPLVSEIFQGNIENSHQVEDLNAQITEDFMHKLLQEAENKFDLSDCKIAY